MPVFRLTDDLIFPPPALAEDNGLLAIGGDLSAERLLLSYSEGIFPWYCEGDPILWWSPDPRLVLIPQELKVSRSLRQTLKRGTFRITFDTAFGSVIRHCASVHGHKDGDTWITRDMIDAYISLHELGYAHSVESWHEGELSGGLYGVAVGSSFFGESMFAKKNDASKAAFVTLVEQLAQWNFTLIDCQITTTHLKRFGAREVPRGDFLEMLKAALGSPTRRGIWELETSRNRKLLR